MGAEWSLNQYYDFGEEKKTEKNYGLQSFFENMQI